MFCIYTILYSIALLFIAPFEYFRRPAQLRRRWLMERFGRIDLQNVQSGGQRKKTIWIHAVSVGEVAASVSLVRRLKENHPYAGIVISTVTDTGQRVANERLGHIARIVYVPFDLPYCVAASVRAIQPDLFIIMETELWPNIIRVLNRQGVPILLMNGRISEKSFRGYLKIKFFIGRILRYFTVFGMQEELYAERLKSLGAPADRISVTGNFKFDTQPAAGLPLWTGLLTGVTIIAGSTHRPEEDIILDAYAQIRRSVPALNLIIAPRHPERFDEVEELVRKRNISYVKRSKLKDGMEARKCGSPPAAEEGQRKSEETEKRASAPGVVIILDVIGELAAVYGAADIAVIGGSFIAHGGQNPLEPAYWGKAIVCGPHMENFPFMTEFYARQAALCADTSTLADILNRLISSDEERREAGIAAKTFYQENAGAISRAERIIARYI